MRYSGIVLIGEVFDRLFIRGNRQLSQTRRESRNIEIAMLVNLNKQRLKGEEFSVHVLAKVCSRTSYSDFLGFFLSWNIAGFNFLFSILIVMRPYEIYLLCFTAPFSGRYASQDNLKPPQSQGGC